MSAEDAEVPVYYIVAVEEDGELWDPTVWNTEEVAQEHLLERNRDDANEPGIVPVVPKSALDAATKRIEQLELSLAFESVDPERFENSWMAMDDKQRLEAMTNHRNRLAEILEKREQQLTAATAAREQAEAEGVSKNDEMRRLRAAAKRLFDAAYRWHTMEDDVDTKTERHELALEELYLANAEVGLLIGEIAAYKQPARAERSE